MTHYKTDGQKIGGFMRKVDVQANGCWHWIGSIGTGGYGSVNVAGQNKAHRLSWTLFNGEIPAGLKVLHKCDVPKCVNPKHLFLGTQQDNVRDMCAKNRQQKVSRFGEKSYAAKLTWAQVDQIRQTFARGESQRQISMRIGVSPMTINRIVNNKAWPQEHRS